LSGFYPIITTASPSNEDLVKSYGATHFVDRNLSGKQLKAAISKVTDNPIGVVYDAISLPETQSVAWELLADNGTLILTLPASVKKDEGRGRKAVHTFGNPRAPQNQELCSRSWAAVEQWLSEGTIQVCFATSLWIHGSHLCSRTNMKSSRTGLKVLLEDWRG
jgi:NADPH:quinone reductase-like Zn-dependent oxidoreductase